MPLALLLAVLYVLAQANPLASLPSLDSGNYLYVARQLLNGKLLYVDVWNHKTFAGYYLNALGLLLSNGNRWGIWMFEFLFVYGASLLAWRVASQVWGKAAAAVGTLFWLGFLNVTLQGGNLTEEYALFFNFYAFWQFYRWQKQPGQISLPAWLIFGALTGVNFFIRPNNIGGSVSVALAVLVLGLLQRDGRMVLRIGLAAFAGFAVVVGASLAFFAWQGNLQQMLDSSLLYNVYYTGEHYNTGVMLRNSVRIFGWGLVLPLAGYATLAWQAIRGQRSPFVVLGLIALPLEVWLSSLSGRGYTHYFMTWLPTFGLLVAAAWASLAPAIFSQKTQDALARAPWLLIAIAALANAGAVAEKTQLYLLSADRLLVNRAAGVQLVNPISEYLQHNTEPNEKVFVWGADAGINFLAQRDAHTPFLRYPLMVDSPITGDMAGLFYQDLTTNPPTYIVDLYSRNYDNILSLTADIREDQLASGKPFNGVPGNIDEVLAFIDAHYTLEKNIGKVNVYRYHP